MIRKGATIYKNPSQLVDPPLALEGVPGEQGRHGGEAGGGGEALQREARCTRLLHSLN